MFNILFSFGDAMFWLWALVVFVLVLGTIVLLHEGGHFFFAKKAGILCHEYAIGMGPVVKSIKKGETSYSIRSIPVGGFVSMAGEDTNESLLKEGQTVSVSFKEVSRKELVYGKEVENGEELLKVISEISVTDKALKEITGVVVSYDLYSKEGDAMFLELEENGEVVRYLVARDAHYIFSEKQKIQLAPFERCYESKTKFQRFMTVFAGPMMNFVLGFLIFIVVGLASGVPTNSNVIAELSESYPASEFLEAGDKIIEINGVAITNWDDVSAQINANLGEKTINVKVEREGEVDSLTFDIPTVNISYRLGVTNIEYIDYEGKGLKVSTIYDDSYVVSKAGIKAGDVILGYYVGEELVELNSWKALFTYLDENPELNSMKLAVEGKSSPVVTDVWTESSMKDINKGVNAKTAIGIVSANEFSFFGGLKNACLLFWDSITAVFTTFKALFANSQISINELSGPVGIFAVIKQYLETDFITFLSFVGLISVNIGLVNLLPLPALDGGRIVFILYELITGKKVNKKVETIMINIVFWLVMGLFVYITFKDVIRLFF